MIGLRYGFEGGSVECEFAQGLEVQTARQFGANQQPADVVVVQVRVQLAQHADAHPVFGLRVDRAAQRVAREPQVFVHGV